MDPISEAIIAALITGVAGGMTPAVQDAVVAGYHSLKKRLLSKNVTNHADLADALARLEAAPTSQGRQAVVVEEVTTARLAEDPDLLPFAHDLLKQVAQTSQGTQIIQKVENSAISNTGNATTYNIQGDQYLGGTEQQKRQTP